MDSDIDIDIDGAADYWEVYTGHRDLIDAELLRIAAQIPSFAQLLAEIDSETNAMERERSFELQRGAILNGDWAPYLQDLRDQGRRYAEMRIEFDSWYAIIRPFRRVVTPLLVERFPDEPGRLRRALEVLNTVTDVAMNAIANGYLVAERDWHQSARIELESTLAELERRNVELQEFAYVTSHDLQEPLRQVSAFAQLLEREAGDDMSPKAKDALRYVGDGARRMRRLITDLLSYSRTDRSDIDVAPVSLSQLVEAVVLDLQTALDEANGSVSFDTLPTVHGDRVLLERVVHNLLADSIKFKSPSRKLEVVISAERVGGGHRVSVLDNGMGVDRRDLERIFKVFQRAHARTTQGTGIGLAICRKAVERHGGRIWAESDGATKTSISFEIPDHPEQLPSRATQG